MGDWSLPFSERYHWLRRGIPDLLREMEGQRQQISNERRRLRDNQRRLRRYWRAWCQLQEDDADQLEALLAHHEHVRTVLEPARATARDEQPGGGRIRDTRRLQGGPG